MNSIRRRARRAPEAPRVSGAIRLSLADPESPSPAGVRCTSWIRRRGPEKKGRIVAHPCRLGRVELAGLPRHGLASEVRADGQLGLLKNILSRQSQDPLNPTSSRVALLSAPLPPSDQALVLARCTVEWLRRSYSFTARALLCCPSSMLSSTSNLLESSRHNPSKSSVEPDEPKGALSACTPDL